MPTRSPRVCIVGGGPGGMAAGIWSVRLGLRPHLIEAGDALGGQLLRVFSPITDYPGFPRIDGPGLVERFVEHLVAVDVQVSLNSRVAAIDVDPLRVRLDDGGIVDADAVILAIGVRRRTLGLANESRLRGRGISYTVSRDKATVAGRDAVVVGGGDAAFEGACILSQVCRRVHLVHRGSGCARPDFRDVVRERPSIRVHPDRSVETILGDQRVSGVRLDDDTSLACEGVFVRIGVEPRTAELCGVLPTDEQGYLRVDRSNRCLGSVYAVGDICSPQAMSVSAATGQAMVACKHIQLCWL